MRPVYQVRLDKVIEALRRAAGDRRLAVLFGSAVESEVVHDLDVLIDGSDLGEALRLSAEIEEALGVPADVVPAGLAPPCLVAEALTRGVVVAADSDYYDELLYLSVGQCQDLKIKLREAGINVT
ncbi:DNA polymerase, beta domain protein region [Thermoproteus uzoniensis 768-20]|uniref:DNA polymerase, beta domain protein region n=1 Tax=Thermoproteus uzoniensis (strain 768-20) TaxID=999630 RepID=F2L1T5_THEU7|nr:nucleotidyltransferase domain-containing protein [Thermoproteus uzoniensis]AEA12941.1 DNA polymerase, beta domain protein region [Thermoproteus uzoniensis 768-20]